MAKKSKGFGELLQMKRMQQAEQKGMEKLQQRVKQGAFGDRLQGVVQNPKGEVKMSEVLEKFVEPYLPTAKTHADREGLFTVAITAWNLAILPEGDRQDMLKQMLNQVLKVKDPLARKEMKDLIDELVERKLKHFDQNKRFIIDFNLQDTGDYFHISVASTPTNPPKSDEKPS